MQQIQETWRQLENAISVEQNISALNMAVYLVMAAVLALYIRLLYRTCSGSPSDTESVSRVFPMLAIVTTAVIAVVKSSLALSLGLVGALSIVRFRAAIKDPEELTYLFLCIAVGLALGAEQPLLALALVVVATVFIVAMYIGSRGRRKQRLMLTITGDTERNFTVGEDSVLAALDALAGRYTLQRFDLEHGRGQIRVVLAEASPSRTAALIARLRERLPECEMSYVNLNATL